MTYYKRRNPNGEEEWWLYRLYRCTNRMDESTYEYHDKDEWHKVKKAAFIKQIKSELIEISEAELFTELL